MTKAVVKKFEKTCPHLLKKAEPTWRVTYEHITEKAGTDASARALRDKVSEEAGVAWHPGRKAIDRTVQEEEKGNSQAESWQRYPEDYWTEAIHGVIDNKTFPVPINADKKALPQKQKVHGHLRKKSEGLLPECVLPQGQRRGIGDPSVEVTACASPITGRFIMFHVFDKPTPDTEWNGEMAQAMYEGPLKRALVRTYGNREFFRVIEDGDPTGY